MKLHTLPIMALCILLAACAEDQRTEVDTSPASEPATEAAAPVAKVDEAFLDHMHRHADHLDTLGFALADEDLASARTPAFWLSRHKTVDGLPAEWQPYLLGMREAAGAVEAAGDLDTARAAAERITDQCQGCHVEAGINRQS